MNTEELEHQIAKYNFYHIIKLTDSIYTPGNPIYVPAQQLFLDHLKALNLADKRVLDIGCRDGLFSFAAEQGGAAKVIGIDNDLSPAATEFLIPYFKSQVNLVQMNLYELSPKSFGLFDVVLFPGVLYHLRYPFWALKTIRDVLEPGGHLLIETAMLQGEKHNAMLFCPIGEDSPYEPTSCSFFNEKGLRDTLTSLGFNIIQLQFLSSRSGFRYRKKAMNWLKTCLSGGHHPPHRNVVRCVIHAMYQGLDRNHRYYRYWEETHTIHSTNVK